MNEQNKEAQVLKLKDGRNLGYAEFGDLKGTPILYFHGYVSSRLEAKLFAEKAMNHGVRIISVDRPGLGLSDFQSDRNLLDWPDDIIELADHLGLDKFIVEGFSGGGPYAVACAYKIPERLICCGIIAGIGPLDMSRKDMMRANRMLFFFERRMPFMLKMVMKVYKKTLDDPEKIHGKFTNKLLKPDRKVMEDPKNLNSMIEGTKEAFHPGLDGAIHEGKIYARPWGFDLKDISPDLQVYLWQGELDINVPISMGRKMCEMIPKCESKFFPADAHFSVAINNIGEIFETLKS